jgi:uncharacterized phage protein (TIGR02216 family)
MAVGLGAMRLSPADFWAMTPREFAAVLRGIFPRTEPLRRSNLAELMKRFPDR